MSAMGRAVRGHDMGMSKATFTRFAALAITAIALLAFAACENVTPETTTQSDSFRVPSDFTLDIDMFNGSIEVVQGDGRSVTVDATIRQPDDVNYSVELDGDTVKAVATAGRQNINPSPGVSLVITAPSTATLKLDTSNGHIEVDGVGTGGVLESSNGRLTLKSVAGRFVLATSNGRITIEDFFGEIDGATSNGRIEFSGTLEDDSENKLRTSKGSITINVGEDANVRVDAETSNGDVNVEIPLDAATIEDDRVVGDIGDGDATLQLRTSNGSVTIR